MNRLLLQGAAGCLSLVALAPLAWADAMRPARVCTYETQQQAMLSRRTESATDRVLALVEGNLPAYAVGIALDDPLRGEVISQQMDIMRSVARELGMVSEEASASAAD